MKKSLALKFLLSIFLLSSCALFDDENLDAAIGRNGMNINLASKITEYKIDGYGVKQYERIQEV